MYSRTRRNFKIVTIFRWKDSLDWKAITNFRPQPPWSSLSCHSWESPQFGNCVKVRGKLNKDLWFMRIWSATLRMHFWFPNTQERWTNALSEMANFLPLMLWTINQEFVVKFSLKRSPSKVLLESFYLKVFHRKFPLKLTSSIIGICCWKFLTWVSNQITWLNLNFFLISMAAGKCPTECIRMLHTIVWLDDLGGSSENGLLVQNSRDSLERRFRWPPQQF